MAKLVDLNLRPDRKTLRQFGVIALFAFGLLALFAFLEVGPFGFGLGSARISVTSALLGLGLLSGILALVYPKGNWPIYVGLSVVFFPVGLVLSYVLLSALFLIVIGPISLLVRAFADDAMRRSYDKGAESYWIKVDRPRAKASYFRQF